MSQDGDVTLPLDDEALLVVLSGGAAGLQHEGVHAGADLSRGDADGVGNTGPEVNPSDRF